MDTAKRTALKCRICQATIYSRARYDFHWCPCRSVAIDGGNDYVKISFTTLMDFEQIPNYDTGVSEKVLFNDWSKRRDKYGIVKPKAKKGAR